MNLSLKIDFFKRPVSVPFSSITSRSRMSFTKAVELTSGMVEPTFALHHSCMTFTPSCDELLDAEMTKSSTVNLVDVAK